MELRPRHRHEAAQGARPSALPPGREGVPAREHARARGRDHGGVLRNAPKQRRTHTESAQLAREIIERYDRDEAHIDIARALGVNVSYSTHVCRNAGLARTAGVPPRLRPKEPPAEVQAARAVREERIVKLYEGRMAHADIARELDVPKNRVGTVCRAAELGRKHGTTPRKPKP